MFRTKHRESRRNYGGLIRQALRLARDQRGNTLMIAAAAFIPILGMIGGGLDIARAYATKTKLQSACDASALAARRQMAGGQLGQAAIDEGARFFNFNFPPGTMQSKPAELDIKADDDDASTVDVSASTAVPTTIMALFGKTEIPLSVQCSADQDYVNNDIMMVLDVTGSMNCTAGTNCDYALSEQSNSRLSRLRSAAAALYRALEGAKGVRTRYGFMPYNMTVNVGKDLDSGWIRNPAVYWQKVCTKKKNGNCTQWAWQQTNPAINHNLLWFASWKGCIEERSTISQNGQSHIRISGDVTQADIDTVSTSDAKLKWQPYDDVNTVGYSAAYDNLAHTCPSRAGRLATYDSETAFQNKLNSSLTTVGGYTNHDLGIMWGTRYLSGTGMFAADNPDKVDEIPVQRHIIFLTDGEMTALDTNYSSFGIPVAEDRMTGGGSLVSRHKTRFLNACETARSMGITIWVIALDVQAPDDIKPCASGEDHFFISNGSDLDKVFDIIGKGIGHLRLTK
jgi:Flp pilus assembly protein TadG